jgi:hypothetical protein
MEKKILYFAYGANMDGGMIKAITGNDHLVGRPAILEGFKLGVQRIDQVPRDVEVSLRNTWGDDFKTYVIYPEEGAKVKGTVWELSQLERKAVQNWELVEDEVGPRLAWYKQTFVSQVITPDGAVIEDLETEILGDGQEIDSAIAVDSLDYNPYLMRPEDMWRIAEDDLKAFLERQNKTEEGSVRGQEVKP